MIVQYHHESMLPYDAIVRDTMKHSWECILGAYEIPQLTNRGLPFSN